MFTLPVLHTSTLHDHRLGSVFNPGTQNYSRNITTSHSQITLESFTLGRFVSYTIDGCPDGYLQISEASRTPVGGMWCGTAWGPVVFYSETRTLILTVKLFK